MIIDIAIFILAAAILIKSSEWIVSQSSHLSAVYGISKFAIGFILISLATSLPELGVAIFSTMSGVPEMSVGGILGSNLTDLTLILGLVAIVGGPIILKKKELIGLVELLFITFLVTLLIFQRSQLTQLHGVILLILFGYLILTLFHKGRIPQRVFDGVEERKSEALFKFIGSLVVLTIASFFLVESAKNMAIEINISQTLIGATLIALATSLPELAVELRAVKSKEYALALGDLFGSAVTNITLVLGLLSVMNPTTQIELTPLIGIVPLFFATLIIIWFNLSKYGKITKQLGVILVILYALFLMQEFGLVALMG